MDSTLRQSSLFFFAGGNAANVGRIKAFGIGSG
jgi:hypothetical protein